MKYFLLTMVIFPSLSWASLYNCSGAGFNIDISVNPIAMKVVGNGFNSNIMNINSTATFDTVITGNSANPAATLKLVIKDSSFANPGDSFKAVLSVSTPTGVKEYAGLTCLRGND